MECNEAGACRKHKDGGACRKHKDGGSCRKHKDGLAIWSAVVRSFAERFGFTGGLVLLALLLTYCLFVATDAAAPAIVGAMEAPGRFEHRQLAIGSNTSSNRGAGLDSGGFLESTMLDIFGDEEQLAYEDFIKALNMACYFEGATVNESRWSTNYTIDFLVPAEDFPDASVVERFVRKNILPTRNTIVVAFATILSSLLAGVIPQLLVAIMMSAFLPGSESDLGSEGGDRGASGPAKVCEQANQWIGLILLLAMGLLAFVPQVLASFFTLERCFVEMRMFWDALDMNRECNFILSTRFLSYHEVFSLLVLGCSCLFDLVLVFAMLFVVIGKCVHCVFYTCCCIQCIGDFIPGFRCCACTHCICYEGCRCWTCACHCWTCNLAVNCNFCTWLSFCCKGIWCPIGLCLAQIFAFLWISLAGFSVVALSLAVLAAVVTVSYVPAFIMSKLTCGRLGEASWSKFKNRATNEAAASVFSASDGSPSAVYKYEFLGIPAPEEGSDMQVDCCEATMLSCHLLSCKSCSEFKPPPLGSSNLLFSFQLGTFLVVVVTLVEFFNQFILTVYLSAIDRSNDELPCWGSLLPFFICNQDNITMADNEISRHGIASYGIPPLNPLPDFSPNATSTCPPGYIHISVGWGREECVMDKYPTR